jgi:RNA polymerase sigma-70 factor (ECF subfamily)
MTDRPSLSRRSAGSAKAEPGDRIAELYDRHGGSLFRYALMILADPAAAADAVQQVFVGLLRAKTVVDSDERYLRRAVRNECYSAYRRKRRDPEMPGEPFLEAVSAVEDRPDERIAIEQAIRVLPPDQREVIHLKVYEGMTFQEIADLFGESKNTIASRYRYAIDKMREQLT